MNELAPFNGKEKIEICFVDVDHSKAVNLVIACLLENHGIDYGLPSVKRMASTEAKVDDSQYRASDKGLFILEGGLTRELRFAVRKRFDKKGFIVSKVAARRRGCGCFAPCLYLTFEFFFGNIGWKEVEFGGHFACVE